jgi:Putative amidoligase enzyme
VKNTILNIIPNLKPTEGDYGVEIEVEGNNLPQVFCGKYWRCDKDDSLKAGFEAWEYVMYKPLDLKGVREALDVLEAAYEECRSEVVNTITAGVHVHVNVQDFTVKQLFTFITTYFTLEELLLTYCGASREGNHFCLRARDAEFIVHELCLAAFKKNFANLNTDNIRYCSLNVLSLFSYGSIEFRAMAGTRDLDSIYEWVEILDRVKNNSLGFNSPSDVISSMSFEGEINFIKRILGDKAHLFLKNPNAAAMVRDGARIIQPLAFVPDWGSFKEQSNNPFVKTVGV